MLHSNTTYVHEHFRHSIWLIKPQLFYLSIFSKIRFAIERQFHGVATFCRTMGVSSFCQTGEGGPKSGKVNIL